MKNNDVSKSPLSPITFQITGEFYEDLDKRVKKIVNDAISLAIKELRPQAEYLNTQTGLRALTRDLTYNVPTFGTRDPDPA